MRFRGLIVCGIWIIGLPVATIAQEIVPQGGSRCIGLRGDDFVEIECLSSGSTFSGALELHRAGDNEYWLQTNDRRHCLSSSDLTPLDMCTLSRESLWGLGGDNWDGMFQVFSYVDPEKCVGWDGGLLLSACSNNAAWWQAAPGL